MAQMTFRELGDRLTMLYTAGEFAKALELVEQNATQFPEQSARTTFWRMCLLSLSDRPQDVLTVFQQGLDSGLWWHKELFADPDLNAVRDLPEFQHLVAVSEKRYEEEQGQVERDSTVLQPEPPSSALYPLLITLHGRNGNKEVDLGRWELARQRGWLVLLTQSTQPVFHGAYHWDSPEQGFADLRFYYDQISQEYQIDPQRVVIAGFSQGSCMSIYTALARSLPVRGFIGIGTWWADVSQLDISGTQVRGYFITGEKDHTLERAREIQEILRKNNVQFAEEIHTDLGHEFSSNFGDSFDKAIDFIFRSPNDQTRTD